MVPQSSCSLSPIAPPTNLLGESLGQGGISLAGETEIQRQSVGRLEHHAQVMGAGRAGGGAGAGGRSGAAADHRGEPAGDRFVGLLRADVMNVRVDAAGGENQSFAGDHFGCHADDHSRA